MPMTTDQDMLRNIELGELRFGEYVFSITRSGVNERSFYMLKWVCGPDVSDIFSSYSDFHEYAHDEADRTGQTFEDICESGGYVHGFESFNSISDCLVFIAEKVS